MERGAGEGRGRVERGEIANEQYRSEREREGGVETATKA